MKICTFSITATLTCAITIFTIGSTHPVDVKNDRPLLNTDTEVVDFAKRVGSELLEIEPSGRTVRKYEKDTLRDSDQTFLCTGQGQVGVPKECKKYHVCARAGAESGGGVCFGEKFFHHQKRECLKITEAECHASMCKNISNKFRDPYNRENFLVCTNMVPEVRRCPDGKIYYPQLRSCESGSAMKGLKESFEEEEEKNLAQKNKNATGLGEIRPKSKMILKGQYGMQGNNVQPGMGNNGPQNFDAKNQQSGMQGNNGQPGMGNNGPQNFDAKNQQSGMQGNNGQPGMGNNGPQNFDAKNQQSGMQGNNGQPGMGNNGPKTFDEKNQLSGMQGNNGQPEKVNNGPQNFDAKNQQSGMQGSNGQPGMGDNGPQPNQQPGSPPGEPANNDNEGQPSQVSTRQSIKKRHGWNENGEKVQAEVNGEMLSEEYDDNRDTGAPEENGDQGEGKSVLEQGNENSVPDPAEVVGDTIRLVLPPPEEEKR